MMYRSLILSHKTAFNAQEEGEPPQPTISYLEYKPQKHLTLYDLISETQPYFIYL